MASEMNTMRQWRTSTADAGETERLAEHIGAQVRGGEVIELVSDLGGGKTTFVRGLARGMGSHERVASPTFTISLEYTAGNLRLHHYDFYRLHEAGIMADELSDVLSDPRAVVVVEWGEVAAHVLPAERLRVAITATGETARELAFECPPQLAYLLPKASRA